MTGERPLIAGAIIAGGNSRRMQNDGVSGDKFLLPIGGQTTIAQVATRLSHQVDHLFINANEDPARFDGLNLPVISDAISNAGPLAGILASMSTIRTYPWLVTVAADTPFFPSDMVAQLMARQQQTNAKIVLAESKSRIHPVFGLWSTSLCDDLTGWLSKDQKRSVLAFASHIGFETASFPLTLLPANGETCDPFFNINHLDDYIEAQRLYKAMP